MVVIKIKRYAIIGFGCAGYNCLRALRELGCDVPVDVYSDMELPPYNPMLTTYYVNGKIPFEAMFPFGTIEEIKKKYPFEWYPNTEILSINAALKEILLKGGEARRYDKVLISTGAKAIAPSVGELPDNRVYSMRTVMDAVRLKKDLKTGKISSALVVGASMVGIKLVELLAEQGVKCEMSDLADNIFPTAAFPEVSGRIEEYLRSKGIGLYFGVKLEKAKLENGKGNLLLSDGSKLETDIVIQCIGTRANTQLVNPAEVRVNRAIVVGADMKTTAEGVYAAGDCCEGVDLMTESSRIIGLWANAGLQGEIAGKNMAGAEARYPGGILHNITHFMDMDFISLGDNTLPGEKTVFLDNETDYIISTVMDGKIQCINILGAFRASGAVKNHLMRGLYDCKDKYEPEMEAALYRGGLPRELIGILGGKCSD